MLPSWPRHSIRSRMVFPPRYSGRYLPVFRANRPAVHDIDGRSTASEEQTGHALRSSASGRPLATAECPQGPRSRAGHKQDMTLFSVNAGKADIGDSRVLPQSRGEAEPATSRQDMVLSVLCVKADLATAECCRYKPERGEGEVLSVLWVKADKVNPWRRQTLATRRTLQRRTW